MITNRAGMLREPLRVQGTPGRFGGTFREGVHPHGLGYSGVVDEADHRVDRRDHGQGGGPGSAGRRMDRNMANLAYQPASGTMPVRERRNMTPSVAGRRASPHSRPVALPDR